MPKWSNQLPPDSKPLGLSLRRTPPDRPLKALVTSDRLLVCVTHWWTGRTVPCEGPDCAACKVGTPGRAHAYLSALESGSRDHFIFEATAKAAAPFAVWIDAYKTLRGCFFTAFRPKRRRNAAVEITCKPFDLSTIQLPAEADIPAAMALIWQLPKAGVEIAQPGDECLEIETRKDLIDRMRFNPADGLTTTTKQPPNGRAS